MAASPPAASVGVQAFDGVVKSKGTLEQNSEMRELCRRLEYKQTEHHRIFAQIDDRTHELGSLREEVAASACTRKIQDAQILRQQVRIQKAEKQLGDVTDTRTPALAPAAALAPTTGLVVMSRRHNMPPLGTATTPRGEDSGNVNDAGYNCQRAHGIPISQNLPSESVVATSKPPSAPGVGFARSGVPTLPLTQMRMPYPKFSSN